MPQLLTKFGLHNINFECTESVHIIHWLWNGRTFCLNLWQFKLFSKKRIHLARMISSGIATTTFHQYNHTGMLYFGYELKITEKYKYVIFRKVKQSKLVITTWKLPSSNVYHGLNNALGICVHEKHYQVLPTQMVPICENLGLGPWTKTLKSLALYLVTEIRWHMMCS